MHRQLIASIGLVVFLGLAAFTPQGGNAQQPKKEPMPSADAVAKSAADIKKLYKSEYAKAQEDPEEARKLAATLLDLARTTNAKEEAVDRFVLFCEARDLFARAGDLTAALSVVEDISSEYAVNLADMKLSALSLVVNSLETKEANHFVAETALNLMTDAIEGDSYETAIALGKVADQAARKAKAVALVASVTKRNGEVLALQKEFGRIKPFADKIKKNADDPEANLELGKYYSMYKGNWDKGLYLMALGSDMTWKLQAQRDLGKPIEAGEQVELGHAWWKLAEKEKGLAQWFLQQRATFWYEQAIPALPKGEERKELETRVHQVSTKAPVGFTGAVAGRVGELRKLEGHNNGVFTVAFAPDGRRVVSGGFDQGVRLWDITTGKTIRTFTGHNGQVWGSVFLADGKKLATAGWDGMIRIWDVEKGNELTHMPKNLGGKGFPGGFGGINYLTVSKDGKLFATGDMNQLVRLWDVASGNQTRQMFGHFNQVFGVAFSPDGTHVASASTDNTVRLWNLGNGSMVRQFMGHNGGAYQVAFAADGKTLFSCGDTTIRQWDVNNGQEVRKFNGHTSTVRCLALSPDGRRLLSGGFDNTVRLWDVASGKELRKFEGHTGTVMCVAFSRDGRRAVSGGQDSTVRVWGLPK
jgi:hypothetical protein